MNNFENINVENNLNYIVSFIYKNYGIKIIKMKSLMDFINPNNIVYQILTDNSSYVMKIRDKCKKIDIENEHFFADYIRLYSPELVANIVKSIKGNPFEEYNNYLIEIFEYHENDVRTRTRNSIKELDLSTNVSVIQILAHFHKISKKFDYKQDYIRFIKAEELISRKSCATVFELIKDDYPDVLNEIMYIMVNQTNELNKIIIHGDFHWRNILFKNRRAYKLIDFEGIVYDSIYYDLASALIITTFYNQKIELSNYNKELFYYVLGKYLKINPININRNILYFYIICWLLEHKAINSERETQIIVDFTHEFLRD